MKSTHLLIILLPGLIMATDYTTRELKEIIDEKEALIKTLKATIQQKDAEIQQKEAIIENRENCPLDGNWTQFTNWTTCSETCGVGWKMGFRTCTNPAPKFGGKDCEGLSVDVQRCVEIENCPVNGGWSNFTEWTICSQTCGNGTKERSRTCTQPKPQFGGEECMGQDKETESCFLENCRESIFIESTGAAAEWEGDYMGRFDRIDRQENRRPVYAQRAGLMFLYHHRGTGSWRVGSPVGSYTAALMVRSTNLVPPATGWQYWDEGKWHTNSKVLLTTSPPDPSSICTSIQVYSAGPAGTAQWELMGSYRWEGDWLNGRKVFVGGRGNNKYLRVNTGSPTWAIGETKDLPISGIESGRATGCPCYKAGPSSIDGTDWWRYVDARGQWQQDESIQVTCV